MTLGISHKTLSIYPINKSESVTAGINGVLIMKTCVSKAVFLFQFSFIDGLSAC
jgi:hypothetical protein